MTRDDIIRMAEEAGFQTDLQDVWITYDGIWSEEFERFAALVAAPLEEEIKRLRFCISEGDAAAAMEYLAHCVEKAVAEEREACAKVCDEKYEAVPKSDPYAEADGDYSELIYAGAAQDCADAIRARGET